MSRGRSDPRPPLSPIAAGARRRRGTRMLLACAVVLAVCAGAVAVVASASDSSAPAPTTAHRATPAPPVPAQAPRPRTHSRPRSPSWLSVRRQDSAVARVLAYTPFIKAGVPRRRMIALTFDDGPSPYTPEIVRALTRLHVPATFFVVGQQLTYFASGLRAELRHGFVIGDHTQNHRPLSLLSATIQERQIQAAAAGIRRLGAPSPHLFRPPYGLYNTRTIAELGRMHMLMVMWSVDPRDWLRPGTMAIARRVLRAARPGAIVELHDGGGDRSQTAAALPAMIRGLRKRGYQFVTVPQLLATDPPPRHQRLGHVAE